MRHTGGTGRPEVEHLDQADPEEAQRRLSASLRGINNAALAFAEAISKAMLTFGETLALLSEAGPPQSEPDSQPADPVQ